MFEHHYDCEVFKLCVEVDFDILNFIDPDTPEDDIVAACAFEGCLVRREIRRDGVIPAFYWAGALAPIRDSDLDSFLRPVVFLPRQFCSLHRRCIPAERR